MRHAIVRRLEAGTIALILGVTTVSMVLHSVMGFGFAQLLAPVLFAVRPVDETVPALLAMAVVINALVVLDPAAPDARWQLVVPLLPGALIGLPLGSVLLLSVEKSWLQVLCGLVIVVAAALQLTAGRRGAGGGGTVTRNRTLGAGALSGLLTTSTGIGAAPAILWIEQHRPSKEVMRWAVASYSLFLCVVGVAVLVVAGTGAALDGLLVALLLTPAIGVGHLVGRHIFRRVDARAYRTAALCLVAASGLATVAAGLL